MVLEKTLESPLDCMEIKPVNPKGNQPWIFTGRTDAEAEAPIHRLPDAKSRFTGKDPDARERLKAKEKRVAEDEMLRQHHRLQWTCILANSMIQGRTEEPGVLQSTGSQRVRHDLATEQQQQQCSMGWRFIEVSLSSYMDLIIIWFHDGRNRKEYYSEKTKSFSATKKTLRTLLVAVFLEVFNVSGWLFSTMWLKP